MLADYLAAVAAGLSGEAAPLAAPATPALSRGAAALLTAASPFDRQHLHVALGGGAGGGSGVARRAALASLKEDAERHHAYAGKV